jgi:hypothetical protein
VRRSHEHPPGSEAWFDAVNDARKENGEHLDEEEREAMPDFIKSASLELRHELGMRWLQFYADHQAVTGIDDTDKDAEDYIARNS